MKCTLAVSVLAALALAGCASQDAQVAKADCKVAPITTASVAGRPPPADRLSQRMAQSDLATSGYRQRQLERNGLMNNNVEEALRDCY
jgi:hypothetical protein